MNSLVAQCTWKLCSHYTGACYARYRVMTEKTQRLYLNLKIPLKNAHHHLNLQQVIIFFPSGGPRENAASVKCNEGRCARPPSGSLISAKAHAVFAGCLLAVWDSSFSISVTHVDSSSLGTQPRTLHGRHCVVITPHTHRALDDL